MSEQTRTLRLCSVGLFLDLQGEIHYINLHVFLMITRTVERRSSRLLRSSASIGGQDQTKRRRSPTLRSPKTRSTSSKTALRKASALRKATNYLVEISRAAMIEAMMWPVHALLACGQNDITVDEDWPDQDCPQPIPLFPDRDTSKPSLLCGILLYKPPGTKGRRRA